MINPNDITTVRVDQLPPDEITLTDIFPFETADQFLKKATFSDLIAFIASQTSALQFEVKRMSVTQTYINDNFDNAIIKFLIPKARFLDSNLVSHIMNECFSI